MKNKIYKLITALALLTVISVNPVYATPSPYGSSPEDGWNYQRQIIDIKGDGYKFIELDSDMYKHSNKDLSDLRIVDRQGEYIPFFLESNVNIDSSTTLKAYESNLIKTFVKNNSHYFDFQIVKAENVDSSLNYMNLNIEHNGNFAKTFEIYGSYDNEKWDFIAQKEMYKISSSMTTSVNFDSLLKYDYYRIVILNNMENVKFSSIDLKNMKSEAYSSAFMKTDTMQYKIKENKEDKTTLITIDNVNKLKLINFQITVSDDFHREYKLNSYLDNTVNYGILSNQENIIKIKGYDNSDTFTLLIKNNDDKPLNIVSIDSNYIIDHMVFNGNENEDYFLQFGNKDAVAPVYDIIYKKAEIVDKQQVDLGNIKRLEVKIPVEINHTNNKLILNFIITIVSILLMFTLLRSMKK